MASTPKPKYHLLGKSRFVHVVRTAAWDRKHSECQQVRKYMVAEKIDYKGKGMSAEAALALDSCPQCGTHEVIEASKTPEERKADRAVKRDETLEKIRSESKPKKKKKGKGKGNLTDPDGTKRKARKSGGMRSSGDTTKEKAEALVAFAGEHGWEAGVDEANPGYVVTASRGAELITCFFVDGKYDPTRPAAVEAGGWTGKLRGVHGCRKQMANEGRDRPHPEPGKGRSGPRKRKAVADAEADVVPDDESPEDALRRVPFSLDDDPEVIMDVLKGKRVRWRNKVSGLVEEAWMPNHVNGKKRSVMSITDHPKTGKRMLNFLVLESVDQNGDHYGAERCVYLDRIVRVLD